MVLRCWASLSSRDDLDNATALIDAALKMDPPLDPIYRRQMEAIRQDIADRRKQRPGGR